MPARDAMHNAQCLAGMAFSNALLGIVHSMAHKTGAAFKNGHIIHGAANAMYLPKVIKFNAKDPAAAERYAYIADFIHLGGNTTEEKIDKLIELLRKMNDDLKIPHCIKHYGEGGLPADSGIVPEDEFLEKVEDIAANALLDACTGSNPRQPSQEEMVKLLKCCYYDTEVDF
jgi:alcohol dehydrogenase class IV